MFLEFVSNLAVKFRNITCEIQKLPSKKPETILKKQERIKKISFPRRGSYSGSMGQHSNIITTIPSRQKHNITVDRLRISEAANISWKVKVDNFFANFLLNFFAMKKFKINEKIKQYRPLSCH